jgi:hypothetical protein
MTAVVGSLEVELAPRPDDLPVVRDCLRASTPVKRAHTLPRNLVVVALVASLTACFFGSGSGTLRPLVPNREPAVLRAAGCWRFDHGANHATKRVPLGAVVFLDTVLIWRGDSAASRSLRASVIPADSNIAQGARRSGWGVDSADAGLVHLWIGDGFTGLSFRLRQDGDTARGDVRGYADIPHFLPPRKHAVRAVHVACPVNAKG